MSTPPPASLRVVRPSRPHLIYGGIEVALSIVVAIATWAAWHSPWTTVLWTLLWLPVSHAIGLAAGFIMAAHGDPTSERRTPAGTNVAVWAYECAASILLLDLYQPWRSAAPLAAPNGPARPVALLLLHGYGCNRAFWLRFSRHLADAGYHADAINLGPIFGDIDDYAANIANATQALAERTRLPVVIVGHSMGGLAARACLQRYPTLPVAHTITLGSPHFGTLHARHGIGQNVRQMSVGSEWLMALANRETDAERARITSIYTFHDNVVYPVRTSVLPGARNIALDRLGHVSLATHPRARALVLETLERVAQGLRHNV
ncbi:esterase/lipase family protein [Pandoraea apista]|uniref:Alpha/beta fold hydrolase n=1 Tax=Pandoraea apista TaxID=93218 RepID=A0ABX9ZHX1_9BURK|nr:alpha/beta fold hydrolase [Pandoraea apista]PTD98345.1 permease [Pandoraea apista]RRJ26379.1 alpha/beta fold hydrolase [Pandoraea apista]RRJ72915.1 alpha/beta fold hydrolase [Pandoraea apista]RSC97883.1 alpha/beta fold hydrolase [Pandoraea apista]RSD08757.1 alpha/beta fold hydrolase [Pandoraea apista]